ncbi:MAG: hypothetical protein ACRD8U_06760 [Pyrinomonadaceae bacterium]
MKVIAGWKGLGIKKVESVNPNSYLMNLEGMLDPRTIRAHLRGVNYEPNSHPIVRKNTYEIVHKKPPGPGRFK